MIETVKIRNLSDKSSVGQVVFNGTEAKWNMNQSSNRARLKIWILVLKICG